MSRYIDADVIRFERPDSEEWCMFQCGEDCNKCEKAVASKEQIDAIPTLNVVVIPEGATNGDMIDAMFTYGEYGTNGEWVHVFGVGGNGVLTFTLDWWNAPYKKGEKA